MDWVNVRVPASRELQNAICELLEAQGALAVTVEGGDRLPYLEPAPGAVADWSRVVVTGLFQASAYSEGLRASLAAAARLPPELVVAEALPDRDWEREWQSRFAPFHVAGRLWLCPSWCAAPRSDAVVVRIDPGLAFGTGTHATTRLCLEYLATHPMDNCDIIDFGCGSGIVAVTALKCGARKAWGVDIDPRALSTSVANARHNLVEERFAAYYPHELPADVTGDVVVANILSGTLIELAPRLIGLVRRDGCLLLSGMLGPQADTVEAAYVEHFDFERRRRDDWALLVGRRRGVAAGPSDG